MLIILIRNWSLKRERQNLVYIRALQFDIERSACESVKRSLEPFIVSYYLIHRFYYLYGSSETEKGPQTYTKHRFNYL